MEKRKRSLLIISWVAPVLALVAAIVFWNEPSMLSAIAAAILLLMMTALYLVERRFSRVLIAALRRLET
ncbi:hypothetical protein AAY78_18875 [Microbacterium sp. Ag1]|nr:hypothetical protein AAY78_18875 [Microbacterium sp. Ag1]